VDEVYFVRDGNHRVSVARQVGAETIEAHVWEYPSRVPLNDDDDEQDVTIRNEYLRFLDRTNLDQTCPEQRIIFTRPGYYRLLEMEIGLHRHFLEAGEGRVLSLPEAAADWYRSVYEPLAEYIAREGLLKLFPGHTEADMIAWIIEYRDWSTKEKGEEVTPQGALNLFRQYEENWLRRLISRIVRLMGWPVYDDRRKNKTGRKK